MLFNTLAFAKFFGVVFVTAWLLVSPRLVPLLPWLAVAGYAVFGSGAALDVVLAAAALVASVALCRPTSVEPRPSVRVAAAAVAVNYVALAFMTFRDAGLDPLLLALGTLGVPVGGGPGWTVPALALGAFAAYHLVRARKIRMIFILLASYVFYAHWDWRFLPLIWASSTVDWLLGHGIYRARDPRTRRLWLFGTVTVNLGVLAVFKYFNFGVDSARAALGALGVEAPEVVLEVALPVGVSFFTFESMSYVIDIYRGHIEPQKSYLEYLSFVAFFPHLVAGPIVRPRDLLPQLAGPARFSAAEASEGLYLIAIGLVKKVAIGDYLAVNLVDRVFDAPTQYSALENYAGVLGYAVQIYCDFSGYTDIAIGVALLLGVRMPLNFDSPYKAADIVDFWRRWHISLSTWLRDYLYISLGGSRRGRARRHANLMTTMLLGGLWHGASWTFVVWGGLHGWALAVTHALKEAQSRRGKVVAVVVPWVGAGVLLGSVMAVLVLGTVPWQDPRLWLRFTIIGWVLGAMLALAAVHRDLEPKLRGRRWGLVIRVASVVGTFHVVCAGWIFFRADSFQAAATVFAQIMSFTTYHPNLHPMLLAVLGVGLLSHYVPDRWYLRCREAFQALPAPAQGLVLVGAGLVLREMATAETVPFVYFQF